LSRDRLQSLVALLAALLAPATVLAQARPEEGLRTGNAHLVVVTASPNEGLEVGIPRDSSYAKGIAFDLQGRWELSYNAFRHARQEFQEMIRDRPSWEKMIRGWILKAEFQTDQSQRLRYPIYYRWGPPSASALYYRGAAKHNKWLAIRAFTGRSDRKLRDEAIEDYQKAIQQSPSYDSARIALAALYHEIGHHAKARQEVSRVRFQGRMWLAVEMAYYHTAGGEPEQALELLDKAIRYNSGNKRYILRSNDFDRLRSNPRFRAIVGEP
jgi:tetratricopeptide (TPR) repeat protein